MARLFFSYASADQPKVRRLADALRREGHETWIDEEDIDVGDSIPGAIERGLRGADFVVVCLSKTANQRGWVEAQRDVTFMQQMQERHARILPVRLEDVDYPYLLQAIAGVDLFPDDAAFDLAVRKLVRAIAKHMAVAAQAVNQGAAAPPGAQAPSNARARQAPAMSGPNGPPQTPPANQAPAPPPFAQAQVPEFRPSPPGTVDIFISCAPSDESFAKELDTALAVLRRQNRIRTLHRRKTGTGGLAQGVITAQLEASRIILLLVSNAFFADDECADDMTHAMVRHEARTARVIPILVRATDEWKTMPIGGLLALPRNGVPVAKFSHADEAWAQIAGEIRGLVDQLLGSAR